MVLLRRVRYGTRRLSLLAPAAHAPARRPEEAWATADPHRAARAERRQHQEHREDAADDRARRGCSSSCVGQGVRRTPGRGCQTTAIPTALSPQARVAAKAAERIGSQQHPHGPLSASMSAREDQVMTTSRRTAPARGEASSYSDAQRSRSGSRCSEGTGRHRRRRRGQRRRSQVRDVEDRAEPGPCTCGPGRRWRARRPCRPSRSPKVLMSSVVTKLERRSITLDDPAAVSSSDGVATRPLAHHTFGRVVGPVRFAAVDERRDHRRTVSKPLRPRASGDQERPRARPA